MIAATLYPSMGMAFLLVPQGLDDTELLVRSPPLRAGMGSTDIPTGAVWDPWVWSSGYSLAASWGGQGLRVGGSALEEQIKLAKLVSSR